MMSSRRPRSGLRAPIKWILLPAMLLLIAWALGTAVVFQMRYLNHQGEGQARRKKHIYSVDELGCDDCSPPGPAGPQGAADMDMHEGLDAGLSEPEPEEEDDKSPATLLPDRLPPPPHGLPRRPQQQARSAKQGSASLADTLAVSAAERAKRMEKLAALPGQHQIRHAVPGARAAVSTSREIRGTGKGLSNPAVLLLAFKRPELLRRTLESLSGLEGLEAFSVYLSQDGLDPEVSSVLNDAAAPGTGFLAPPRTQSVETWQHPRPPRKELPYAHQYLSIHYGWALRKTFHSSRRHSAVVVIEDDMLFSSDFLVFFQAVAPVLEADSSLWCASSWNDNGHKALATNQRRLFRTSFFPGLGWLMPRKMWEEVGPSWPEDNWDWWLRQEHVSKGRGCVVPEMSRNFNLGEEGSTMGRDLYKGTIANWAFHAGPPVEDFGDLSYLLEERFEGNLRKLVARARVWRWQEKRVTAAPQGGVYLLLYRLEDYQRLAQQLPVWPVEPRSHHAHLAEVTYRHSTFLLADIRNCPLLPEALRELPPPGLLRVLGQPGEASCSRVCEQEVPGGTCSLDGFAWLRSCSAVASASRVGGCTGGCSVLAEAEAPTAPALMAGKCVVRADSFSPACDLPWLVAFEAAKTPFRRICPCLPRQQLKRR